MSSFRQLTIFIALAACSTMAGAAAKTGTVPDDKATSQAVDSYYARWNLQTFVLHRELENSPLNPSNNLQIPHQDAQLNLRPDLGFTKGILEFGIKPRLSLRERQTDQGAAPDIKDTDTDAFIQEWLMRIQPTDTLLLSAGRENLQWGPAYLLSASNPFGQNNGRNNPELEVPGMDYAKATWIPNDSWTATLIANTGAGRVKNTGDFEKTYAVKVDYVAQEHYFSVIPAYQKDRGTTLGWLANFTLSDALILYAEGSFFGKQSATQALAGGSYTFLSGPTLSAEFFHQNHGCIDDDISRCVNPATITSRDNLPGLFRKNYALLQYTDTEILQDTSMTLRWLRDVDDQSNQAIAIVEHDINNQLRLFMIGDVFSGGSTSEYGTLLKSSIMAGINFTF